MTTIFSMLVAAGVVMAADAPKEEEARLLGGWEVVSATSTGEPKPWLAWVESLHFSRGVPFRETQLPDSVWMELIDGRVLTCAFRLRPTAKPRATEEQSFRGVWMIEGQSLKLCLGMAGDPRPTDFEPRQGYNQTLLILKRKA
jgi:hypothetical protein